MLRLERKKRLVSGKYDDEVYTDGEVSDTIVLLKKLALQI